MAMLESDLTFDYYRTSDSSNVRFQAFAYVAEQVLHVTLRTKLEDGTRSSVLRGKEQFALILKHFAGRFTIIRGNWQFGDNLAAFNQFVKAGLSPPEAALQTKSGQWAQAAGYDKVEVLALVGQAGDYASVKVNFRPQPPTRLRGVM